jgi:hypothetical protein
MPWPDVGAAQKPRLFKVTALDGLEIGNVFATLALFALRLPARAGRRRFRGELSTNFIAHFMHFSGYGSSRFIATRRREKQADPDSNSDPCRKKKSLAEHVAILAAKNFGRPRHSLCCGFVRFLGTVAQIAERPGSALSHTLGCAVRLIEQIKANTQQGFENLVHRGSFHGSSFQSSISSQRAL